MLLKSLTLRNIRSYIEQQVEFPAGSVLLAGDIGSGKSTILLSIEFALFGLLRGDVDGAALLRNGSRDGFVELTFSLDDKEYSIRRLLKRAKDKVAQDAGWLAQNGVRKDGTAQELKAWVLDLLGYPKEFLTKSKALLFRYTVFTPQEEMKRILFEDRDARLETLRRVFDVDKYKRIKENCQTYVRELREERKKLEGVTQDLESKQAMLQLKREELAAVQARENKLHSSLETTRQQTLGRREIVGRQEEIVRDALRIRAELNAAKTGIAQQEQAVQRSQSEHQRVLEQLQSLQAELISEQPASLDAARKEIKTHNANLLELERVLRESHVAIAQIAAGKNFSEEIKAKVSSMNSCPICLQSVTTEHKNRIAFTEDQKLRQLEALMHKHCAAKEQFENQLVETRQALESARRQESEVLLASAKRKSVEEKNSHAQRLLQTITALHEQLNNMRKRHDELSQIAAASSEAEAIAQNAKKQFEAALAEERKIEIEYHRLAKEREGIEAFANSLQEEVKQKENAKEKLMHVASLQSWLVDCFSSLMDVMEKHVLSRVHHEFNELFQRWFSTLIEDELLTSRLDDAFTPVITQNGYDLEVGNLSGGEKTACALAYRLALNKVINDVMSSIRSKDLLILDEPTDGFSAEQLDKVRDVLSQLGLSQVIIVSHENKIESMVDTVMKVEKTGHVSRVVATS